MRIRTKVVRAGLEAAAPGEPIRPGVTFAGTYHAAGDPSGSPYSYGRYHNPTWTRFEGALGELEGGTALSFASGMAAVAAVLGSTLRPGDILVLPADSYYTSRLLAEGFFGSMGIQVRQAPTAANGQARVLDGAKLLWLESPSNPGLEVCDIAALAEAARRQGALVAVDNTTATLLGQRPLELGADFSVASDSKALTGHADLILGHVAVRDAAWADRLRSWRNQTGAVPGPMEVWLAHRSLATLEMRLERQCRNALIVAEYLSGRRDVTGLRYPGLHGDAAHEVAARQMQYYGPVVSFALADRSRAERFLGSCELVIESTSFGGVHTSAERRARWGGDAIPEGFIRLSVGCEDDRDIVADLAQALDRAP
ncbi:MAG TPA: cystathionine gamma-lyase [Candidatus Polarisedimenticolia bacterium]|jgi:cystathionine gamma-lyase|nr:cystathionine gamma-lyase [Candidatus Polarisedimenticolia bacterium]